MLAFKNWVHRTFRDEEGATSVEYAVLLSLIACVVVVGVTQLTLATGSNYERTSEAISSSMK